MKREIFQPESENINIPEYAASLERYLRLVSETMIKNLLRTEGKKSDPEGAALVTEQFPKFIQRIDSVVGSEDFKQMSIDSQSDKIIPLGIGLRKLNEQVDKSVISSSKEFISQLEDLISKFEK